MKTTLRLIAGLQLKCLFQIRSLGLVHESMMPSNPNKTVAVIFRNHSSVAADAAVLNHVFLGWTNLQPLYVHKAALIGGVLRRLATV